MNNVVLFPRQKKDSPPNTIEELYENVAGTRKEHIEYILDDVLSFVFQRCFDEGFNLGQDDCLKTTALIVDTLRAGLYNTVGIPHPLHASAEIIYKDGVTEPIEP